MAKFTGQLVNVGIAKEATRGAGATPTFWLPKTAITFDDRVTKAISEEGLGVIDDANDAFVTQLRGEGSIEGYIRDKSFGLLVMAMLGGAPSTGGANPYTHTWTGPTQTNQHQSLAFSVLDPIGEVMFKLVMLEKLSIMAELNEIVKYQADFISRDSDPTDQTASYTNENKFVAKHVTIKTADAVASLDAAAALPIKSFKIDMIKNLMPEQDLGTATLADIHNQRMEVSGEIELLYEDRTYRDYMLNGTYKCLRLDIVNSEVALGGGLNPRLKIDMPRVHFFDWEADRSNDKIAGQKIKFKALYDLTNSLNLINSLVLINANSAY